MPVFGYRQTTNHNIPKSGHPVCVSVVFNPLGEFKPVAFGIETDGMRYRYVISAVNSFRENHCQFIFDCEYLDLGRVKSVRLVFDVMRMLWVIG